MHYLGNVRIFFAIVLVLFLHSYANAQTYNTPGTYTWTVPPCVTEITVKVWGAGGGGGGTASRQTTATNEACTQGGGGGGGGFAMRTYSVTPGETYTIVVGAGGSGGAGANNTAVPGATGGSSTFTGSATTPFGSLTGFGGIGGGGATANNTENFSTNTHIGSNGTGGTGGTGANGTTNFIGGNGSSGSHSASCNDLSGAGGGGAGTTGNGSNGQQIGGCPHNSAMQGGAGAPIDGGQGGNGVRNNIASRHMQDGNAGSPYGGGGGGAGIHLNNWTNTWSRANGGNGAHGAVIIEYPGGATNPPTAVSPQEFCVSATVADLTASGSNLAWYTQSTGGSPLDPNESLNSNTTYYVSQTVNNCESDRTPVLVNIHDPAAPIVTPPNLCSGATSTLADINVSGTNIQWYSHSAGGNLLPSSTTLVPNTTYYASQSVGNCESDRTPVLITINNSPTDIILSSTATECGQPNGEVTLGTVTDGTAPYQYNFNNQGFSSTTTYSNLAGGTYSVIVRDDNGCTYTTSVNVSSSNAPTAIVTTSNPASCGTPDGEVTLGTVTGGTAPYQYNFNNQGFSSTTTYSNLAGGTYSVIVRDDNGCTYTTSVNVSSSNAPTAIVTTSNPASCGTPDGEVTLGTVTGGTAPYQYNFNNQGFSSTTTYSNLTGGTYSVIVRDNNGCTYTTSVNVSSSNAPTAIVTTSNPASCGTPDGEVTLGTVTGGTAPYQYNFNNQGFSSTTTYSNLAGGTYSVIVRDDNGCTYTTSVTVGSSNAPTAIVTTSNPASCGTADGEIILGTVTGGTAPYQYNFNNQGFSSTTTYSNLPGGTYSVVVRDNNGCTYTTSVNVSSSNAPTGITFTSNPASCETPDGEVILGAATGGTAPYQYNFNNQGFSSTTTYSNLPGGTYNVIVRDNNGCTYTTSVNVGSSNTLTAIAITSNPASCGTPNGEVTLGTVTGGTAPYQYNFNNQGFSSTTTYSNLTGGNYSVVVRDNNGCTYTTSVNINTVGTPPTDIDYTIIAGTCEENGSFIVTDVYGGTAPYVFSHNGTTIGDTINVPSGNYTLFITDANGCQLDTVLFMPEGTGEERIHIPNVFTPNGDLVNDTWFISGTCIISLECVIVNRWGEVMHRLNNINEEWNGQTNGNSASSNNAPEGVYFYKAKVTYYSGKTEDFHGHITLVDQ